MEATLGLFLNMGANLAPTHREVFKFTLEQTLLAEQCGFHDVWVTEHHFIPFGLNPSALTAAAFLLGRTSKIRVGTAVVLSPLYHPLEVTERVALLDQMTEGRLDIGLGRGGYLKDYEMLEVDTERWCEEPARTAEAITACWSCDDIGDANHTTGATRLYPEPVSEKPPLFLATASPDALKFAADQEIPLLHYFATPISARNKVAGMYQEAGGSSAAEHVHTLLLHITDNETGAREHLFQSLSTSFANGDWPHVPNAPKRHVDKDGKPLDRSDMARNAADGALIGSIDAMPDKLDEFIEATGARRLVLYMEAIAKPAETLRGIETLAEKVFR